MKIKLQKNLYAGRDVGYSQLFGVNAEAYKKFNLKGHNGIDMPIPVGTTLFSAINGTVTESENDKKGYGIYVKIENNSCGVLYGHLKGFYLKVGDKVKAGDVVGYSGNTGNSTGPHLHFGVFPIPRDRNNGFAGYIDPLDKNLVNWVGNINQISLPNFEMINLDGNKTYIIVGLAILTVIAHQLGYINDDTFNTLDTLFLAFIGFSLRDAIKKK